MPVSIDINQVKERTLQKAVCRIISEPSRIWQTANGNRLQFLSSGIFNVAKGPDFLDTAILLNGIVFVGDCEFHRRLSDWDAHRHSLNPDFDNVVLQIVINGKARRKFHHEILVISEAEILAELKQLYAKPAGKPDMASIEELQHYALERLMLNADIAQGLLNNMSVRESLSSSVLSFIRRYSSKSRRPVYSDRKLQDIIEILPKTQFHNFLADLKAGSAANSGTEIKNLQSCNIPGLGKNLKKEIVHNCILPLALCLALEQPRIDLFEWYWSSKALNTYGILSRRFPGIPQDYLWQQQGMLEYIKRYGGINRRGVREVLAKYITFSATCGFHVGRLAKNYQR